MCVCVCGSTRIVSAAFCQTQERLIVPTVCVCVPKFRSGIHEQKSGQFQSSPTDLIEVSLCGPLR